MCTRAPRKPSSLTCLTQSRTSNKNADNQSLNMEEQKIDFDSSLGPDIDLLSKRVARIRQEIGKVIVGQEETVDLILAGIFTGGHILLEGVPGIAKTLTAK